MSAATQQHKHKANNAAAAAMPPMAGPAFVPENRPPDDRVPTSSCTGERLELGVDVEVKDAKGC